MKNKIEGSPVYIILADHDVEWMMQAAQEISSHPQVKVIGFAQDGTTLVERAVSMMADAVLMNFSIQGASVNDIAAKLADESPGTAVFAVSDSITMQLEEMAKSAGVVEVFDKNNLDMNFVANQVGSYVDGLRRKWSEIDRRHKDVLKREEAPSRTISQTIILTYNVKGGVGKSTIAANLATAIKMSPYLKDLRVCLVDFDCGGANAATNCHISDLDVINRNLSIWEYLPEDASGQELDEILIKGPQGIMVAAAPINQVASERINAELADKILRILKKHFTVIVIDGAPNTSEPVDVAFTHSTHILMISNAEGQSVKQLSRTMQLLLPDPEYPEKPDMSHILNKMFLVLNHAQPSSKWDLKKTEISKVVGKPIYAEIPYDDVVKRALHGSSGKMAIEVEPNSDFSVAIKNLANDICRAYPGKSAKKGGILNKIIKGRR